MKRSTGRRLVPIRVIGELLFLYGLLGGAYGVVIQVTHPSWLPIPMSHWTRWLRVDDYTIVSFIVSAVGFGLWRLESMVMATTKIAHERGS
jgi:hypothetical protein